MTARGALLAAAALLVLLPGCAQPARTPVGPSATATSSPPTSARIADLDRLVGLVDRLHPDPFHDVDEPAWRTTVAELRGRIDALDRAQTLVELARVTALGDHDGHAGLFPLAQDDLDGWPLWLYDLDGALTLVASDADVGVPLGARLTAVGRTPIAEVVAAVEPIVPGDNAHSRLARIPGFVVVPSILQGLGLLDEDPVELTWQLPDGTEVRRPAPATVPVSQLASWFGAFQAQVPPSLPPDPGSPMVTLQRRDEVFWWTRLAEDDAVYVAYNQVQETDPQGGSLVDLLEEVRAEVARDAPRRVVIDIRHNPGGETDTSRPLTEWVREVEDAQPGTVRILMGRSSFSAATLFVADVQEVAPDVTLVGEPTGGSPSLYADVHPVTLEALGATVFVATEHLFPADDRVTIEPDVPVWFTWDDLARGRDPVLDAALS